MADIFVTFIISSLCTHLANWNNVDCCIYINKNGEGKCWEMICHVLAEMEVAPAVANEISAGRVSLASRALCPWQTALPALYWLNVPFSATSGAVIHRTRRHLPSIALFGAKTLPLISQTAKLHPIGWLWTRDFSNGVCSHSSPPLLPVSAPVADSGLELEYPTSESQSKRGLKSAGPWCIMRLKPWGHLVQLPWWF